LEKKSSLDFFFGWIFLSNPAEKKSSGTKQTENPAWIFDK
jgi:hypothetical protein